MRITKSQQKTLDEHRAAVHASEEALEKALEKYNKACSVALDRYADVVKEHNDAVREAREFVEEIAGGVRENWDEKSEKWQGSAGGESAKSFVEAWEAFSAEDLDPPDDEEIEMPDSVADMLDALPEESE